MAAHGDFNSITLYGPAQAQVIERLRAWTIHGFVSPTVKRITVVHADGWFHDALDTSLEERLSVALACVVMRAVVRDEAVLYYQVYDDGVLVDEYDSFPAYGSDEFPAEPMGGDAVRLCKVFHAEDAVDTVYSILRMDWYGEGAHQRHLALIEALHLPAELFGPEAIDDAGLVEIKKKPTGRGRDTLSVVIESLNKP